MSETGKLTLEDLDRFLGSARDDLFPYLQAAAVLAAFDPFELRPVTKMPLDVDRGEVLDYLLPKSEPLPSGSVAGLWTLILGERRDALRQLADRQQMLTALSANSSRPDAPTQRMLESVLNNAPIALDSLSRADLAALLTVVSWFEGILTDLPDPSAIRKTLARADFLAPMRRLAEKGFIGREKELRQLEDYVVGPIWPAPLFVHGTGGVGKSTLLSRFILTSLLPKNTPVAYIDLDRPTIHAERPLTIVLETVDQLRAQLDLPPGSVDSFNKEIAAGLRRQESTRHLESAYPASSDVEWVFQTLARYLRQWFQDRAGVLIVDTMEEAQFLGPEVVSSLVEFLLNLNYSTGLRCILAGRALPQEVLGQAFQQVPGQAPVSVNVDDIPLPYRPICLGDLDPDSARQLLIAALHAEGVAPLLADEIDQVIGIVSRNPMCLRLAARLLRDEGPEKLRANRSEFLAKLRAEKIQALLYCRILLNVHGEEVRKVAYPGLIVRRITPEVIREVLAVPCDLKFTEEVNEHTIFDELSREAALVELDPADNSLHHRADVRRVMLADLTDHVDAEVVDSIDSKATEFYARQTGGAARAEEIYHRLRRCELEETLNARWIPEAGAYLKGAGDELPAQQRLWLASKLGVTLEDSVRQTADQEAWERQVSTAADRFLLARSPDQALRVLRERTTRLPRSRLYNLEAEALRFLGDYDEALTVARAGVDSAGKAGATDMALELLFKMVLIEEARGHLEGAADSLKETAAVAANSSNRLMQLSVKVAALRLQRKSRPEATEERASLLKDAMGFITPEVLYKLRAHPVQLREAAIELGGDDPRIAAAAIETLGLEVGTDQQARTLGEAIAALRRSGAYDLAASAPLVAEADEFEKSNFEPKQIREWAKNVLTGSNTRDLAAILGRGADKNVLERFGDYFQSSETSALEAIVVPAQRPVALIRGGSYKDFQEPWLKLNAGDVKARIAGLLPSIGRIELLGSTVRRFGGTGFMVGKGLVMTTRSVAELFSQGAGLAVQYEAGSAAIDFRREVDAAETGSKRFEVTGVAMMHPFWDMALLQVGGSHSSAALILSITPPEELVGRSVVVIGYPTDSSLIESDVVGQVFGVKQLQPGVIRGRAQIRSFESVVNAITHDASTLSGSAGSPVIDVDSGEVVALHFGGDYRKANYGVPMFELARDRHVAPLLNFAGPVTATSDWDAAWQRTEKAPGALPQINNSHGINNKSDIIFDMQQSTLSAKNALNRAMFLVETHKSELEKQPGVVDVQPGFKTVNDWPTKEPAIVVTRSQGTTPTIPAEIDGVRVEVRDATDVEELRYSDPARYAALAAKYGELQTGAFENTAAEAPVAPEVLAKPQEAYTPAAQPLKPVSGNLTFTCHASPDAGWPTLKAFLSKTQSRLTVGLYDFTSEHILDGLEKALGSGQELEITMDNPARNPTADQSDTETLKALKQELGDAMTAAWAPVRSNKAIEKWIFPTAYHIKVAVRDGKSVWLSSGNWNNSNQPDMDPINDPRPTDQATAKKSDRDWHVVIDNQELAAQYEMYLSHDNDVARTLGPSGAGLLAVETPEEMPAFEIEAKAMEWQFHAPLVLNNEEATITPLLTPDEGVYQPAMLDLIKSASSKLYIQLQYIHPSDKDEDADFAALVDAVAGKIQAGVDVRIICSQYQVSNSWLDRLQSAGIDLDHVKIQNGVHNKGFVVDSKKVALGSQNWSGDGVLRNRDASVIIENEKAAAYFEQIFLHDWDRVARQSIK